MFPLSDTTTPWQCCSMRSVEQHRQRAHTFQQPAPQTPSGDSVIMCQPFVNTLLAVYNISVPLMHATLTAALAVNRPHRSTQRPK